MNSKGIDRIGSSLRELLGEREIIARCELLHRTYDFVRNAELGSKDREELQRMVGPRIAPGIFASMMSGTPIFFDLPRLDTYAQMNGQIFHFIHTQKYSKQDFDNAYRKFLASQPLLKVILPDALDLVCPCPLDCEAARLHPYLIAIGGRDINYGIYA